MTKKQDSFEDKVKRIREITEQMQEEDIGLEDSLKLFEEGTALIRECQDYLSKAELKVRKIMNKNQPDQMEDFVD